MVWWGGRTRRIVLGTRTPAGSPSAAQIPAGREHNANLKVYVEPYVCPDVATMPKSLDKSFQINTLDRTYTLGSTISFQENQ